ncbi:hypothetical protein AGMMS49949_06490 [Alphaproteobacteria bacterium]|nr:hypothetical protein AGMMS49949_06490 [Alphaproteobacteria bacterium]GHS98357.1 hypothetical protein AGMMS50296_5970 [Alphaproteobacteria bacterium]
MLVKSFIFTLFFGFLGSFGVVEASESEDAASALGVSPTFQKELDDLNSLLEGCHIAWQNQNKMVFTRVFSLFQNGFFHFAPQLEKILTEDSLEKYGPLLAQYVLSLWFYSPKVPGASLKSLTQRNSKEAQEFSKNCPLVGPILQLLFQANNLAAQHPSLLFDEEDCTLLAHRLVQDKIVENVSSAQFILKVCHFRKTWKRFHEEHRLLKNKNTSFPKKDVPFTEKGFSPGSVLSQKPSDSLVTFVHPFQKVRSQTLQQNFSQEANPATEFSGEGSVPNKAFSFSSTGKREGTPQTSQRNFSQSQELMCRANEVSPFLEGGEKGAKDFKGGERDPFSSQQNLGDASLRQQGAKISSQENGLDLVFEGKGEAVCLTSYDITSKNAPLSSYNADGILLALASQNESAKSYAFAHSFLEQSR